MAWISRQHSAVCATGMGVVTSLGLGKEDNWAALTQGRSGVTKIRRFTTEHLGTTIGATIDFDDLGTLPFPVRTERLARLALDEALAEAQFSPKYAQAPLFVGVPPAEMSWKPRLALALEIGDGNKVAYKDIISATSQGAHRFNHPIFLSGGIAMRLAESYGTTGAPVTINTACATGATVIQLAVEAIRRGETDAALVVAADASIVPDTIIRFSILAALSASNDPPEGAARPFSLDRDGFVIGEGGAALVLENYQAAKARGRPPLGFVTGLGESADSYHITRSSPDGAAIVAAMSRAINDSGLRLDEIQYVNAHGTGTPENDRVEGLAFERVFGSSARTIPISSNKSMIGHTMSAAGAIEAVFSLLTIKSGMLPPTINYRIPDPALPLDVVPNSARPANVENVLSNSFGFGGQNVCLVLSRESRSRN
ncbi:MAG: beta-ketoacyl synthase N-terminal-like domain-containing protein [Steroidobacteraceae bacterium]